MTAIFTIACATCRPAAGSLAAQAQDGAVIAMLSALFIIFAVLFYTIFSFARKQSRAQALEAALYHD